MSAANTGGPAFPVPVSATHFTSPGMDLRDWLAAQAMAAATIGHLTFEGSTNEERVAEMARESYKVADAMIEARQA